MVTGAIPSYQRSGKKPVFWLLACLGVLLITCFSSFFGVPVLSPVLGFLIFTFLPGLAILYILKIDQVDFLERLLFSVGLSLAFLIAVGLAINFLYPVFGYSTPLSATSLVISIGVATALLCLGSYFRNRRTMPGIPVPSWPKGKLVWPLILSISFPLLSALGTQVMEAYGDNRLMLVLYFLIPAYMVLLILLRKKIVSGTYPVAIGMISVAILLAWGLTSGYLMGGDIYVEYQTVQIILGQGFWSNSAPPTPINMSLGISLLPVIYTRLLSISAVFVFKVVILLLASFVPLAVYALARRFLDPLYAFLSSCFFMVQLPFINLFPRQGRVDIALIFFSLSLLVLFNPALIESKRRTLFIIFGLTLTVSYYVTPLLLLLLVLALLVASPFMKKLGGQRPFTQVTTVFLIAIVLVLWWGQSQYGALPGYVTVVVDMIRSLGRLAASEMEGTWVAGLYQFSGGTLRITRVILQQSVNLLIGIGVLYALWKRKQLRLDYDFLIALAASLCLLVLYLGSPLVSRHYGGDRLFIQVLVTLSPAFILGCLAISLGKNRLALVVVSILLVSQFLVSTFTIDQMAGVPSSLVLNREGTNHDATYVYNSEVAAAQWLSDHTGDKLNVEIDFNPKPRTGWMFEFTNYQVADKQVNVRSGAFTGEQHEPDSYLFLRHANIVNGWVYLPMEYPMWELSGREPLAQYASMLSSRNKIYSNGSAEVYR